MRLVVKNQGKLLKTYQFNKGPVYIGRHIHSQVYLPDASVSRQHAVLFDTPKGKWYLEDLDSANRTYLNAEEIHKTEVTDGDIIRIVDFTLDIDLKQEINDNRVSVNMEDTLTSVTRDEKTIIRKHSFEKAPPLRMPASRVKNFIEAAEHIYSSENIEQLVRNILNLTARQFSANRNYCAVRLQPSGKWQHQTGKKRSGQQIKINEIEVGSEFQQVVEKQQCLLFPRMSLELRQKRLQSAIIAPLLALDGCYGLIYVDNSMDHEHYTLSDVDYLMILAVSAAAFIKSL